MAPASDRALPHAISPPAYAIASAIAMSFAVSGGNGNDVFATVMLIGALAAVAFSTRFTVRTYRRLGQQEFSRQQIVPYLGVILAGAVNGVVCFMVAGYLAIVLGMLLTAEGWWADGDWARRYSPRSILAARAAARGCRHVGAASWRARTN
jgi:hypothetical protein